MTTARTRPNRYGVAAGKSLLVFTTNDSAYQVALDWHAAGLDVAAIVDSRPDPRGDLANAARERMTATDRALKRRQALKKTVKQHRAVKAAGSVKLAKRDR